MIPENRKRKMERGLSLVEVMITMALFFLVMGVVYELILQTGDVTREETARTKLQQETRFLTSAFSDELKESGAVITGAAAVMRQKGSSPFFKGIYPLNLTHFPDGIILASGDPDASTKLKEGHPFTPNGQSSLVVEDATGPVPDGLAIDVPGEYYKFETHPWTQGDKGIVLGNDGYYIFYVTAVDRENNTLFIRESAVYYSGLLDTNNGDHTGEDNVYKDVQNTTGDAITYPDWSPVMRISNFSIFLFKEIPRPHLEDMYIRQFIRINDTQGIADVLSLTPPDLSVMSENIWEMQISYIAYSDFKSADQNTSIDPNHHYFAGIYPNNSSGIQTSTSLPNLLTDLRNGALKQVDVNFVAITDDFPGQAKFYPPYIKNLGDREPFTLLEGKFSWKIAYKRMSFSVEPRNLNITYDTYNQSQ